MCSRCISVRTYWCTGSSPCSCPSAGPEGTRATTSQPSCGSLKPTVRRGSGHAGGERWYLRFHRASRCGERFPKIHRLPALLCCSGSRQRPWMMMSITRSQLGWACCFVLGTACEHSSPVDPDPYPPMPPFSALLPRRLTFNTGDDRTPAWLPDGSGIVYSTERQDRSDHDRCLAVLPAEGGTIRASYCQLNPIHDDSTDLMEAPAVNSAGGLFFHRVVSWVGQQKLGASALMLGTADQPIQAALLRPLPYTAPNGRLHSSVRLPQWIGEDSLVYLAEQLFYEGSTFYPDTFTTGLDIVLVDFSGGAPRFEVVPETDYASGLDVGDDAAS